MPRNNYELAKVYGVTEEALNRELPCYYNGCRGHFVLRMNKKNLTQFFGCSRYPKCKATRSYDSVTLQLDDSLLNAVDWEEWDFNEEWG